METKNHQVIISLEDYNYFMSLENALTDSGSILLVRDVFGSRLKFRVTTESEVHQKLQAAIILVENEFKALESEKEKFTKEKKEFMEIIDKYEDLPWYKRLFNNTK